MQTQELIEIPAELGKGGDELLENKEEVVLRLKEMQMKQQT